MADKLKKAAGVGFRNQSAYQAAGWPANAAMALLPSQVAPAIRQPFCNSFRHHLSLCPVLIAG